jgi:hypothetical protein
MSQVPNPLGFATPRLQPPADRTEHVIVQRPLHRIMRFIGCTIDQIVNDPVVKNQVLGYYKVQKQVQRGCEIVDLERWWNPRPKSKRKKSLGRGRRSTR